MSVETERSSTESCGASGLDFEDTALTLTLRLPGSSSSADPDRKRGASSSSPDAHQSSSLAAAAAGAPPAPKAQVVGWPPVRAFRKNALADVAAAGSTRAAPAAKFVKVAVDGAPYLRKVNLQDYACYDQLLRALQDKFCSHFTISNWEVRERRDEAGGRRERHGVRAHVRGQGRGLDARRRRPMEDVCGSLPTPSSHEELRGRQLGTESCPMKHTAWPLRRGVAERREEALLC